MASQSIHDPTSQMVCDRVKALRKKNHWTLEELSVASKVSRSMLSQIERGQANPTLAVAYRIAQAFNISIGDLVDEPWVGSYIQVVHSSDPTSLYRSDPQCRIRTLSPLNMEKNVEFYEVKIAPGVALESTAHFEGTHELFTLNDGRVEIVSGNDICQLKQGDTAHYRADVFHKIENIGKNEIQGYMVVTYN